MSSPFPVDDLTLSALEHALDAAYEVDDEGTHTVVGAEFNLTQLLDFLSGYDPADTASLHGNVSEHTQPLYTRDDVIRALIAEVRRLRNPVSADLLHGRADSYDRDAAVLDEHGFHADARMFRIIRNELRNTAKQLTQGDTDVR